MTRDSETLNIRESDSVPSNALRRMIKRIIRSGREMQNHNAVRALKNVQFRINERQKWQEGFRHFSREGKVAIVYDGHDCDGVRYHDERLLEAPKSMIAFIKELDEHRRNLEGPESISLLAPNEIKPEQYTRRDRVHDTNCEKDRATALIDILLDRGMQVRLLDLGPQEEFLSKKAASVPWTSNRDTLLKWIRAWEMIQIQARFEKDVSPAVELTLLWGYKPDNLVIDMADNPQTKEIDREWRALFSEAETKKALDLEKSDDPKSNVEIVARHLGATQQFEYFLRSEGILPQEDAVPDFDAESYLAWQYDDLLDSCRSDYNDIIILDYVRGDDAPERIERAAKSALKSADESVSVFMRSLGLSDEATAFSWIERELKSQNGRKTLARMCRTFGGSVMGDGRYLPKTLANNVYSEISSARYGQLDMNLEGVMWPGYRTICEHSIGSNDDQQCAIVLAIKARDKEGRFLMPDTHCYQPAVAKRVSGENLDFEVLTPPLDRIHLYTDFDEAMLRAQRLVDDPNAVPEGLSANAVRSTSVIRQVADMPILRTVQRETGKDPVFKCLFSPAHHGRTGEGLMAHKGFQVALLRAEDWFDPQLLDGAAADKEVAEIVARSRFEENNALEGGPWSRQPLVAAVEKSSENRADNGYDIPLSGGPGM